MKKLKGSRRFIVDYLLRKDAIVFSDTGMHYVDIEDVQEVAFSWTKEKCEDVKGKLTGEIDTDRSSDCPWCLFNSTCYSCVYGKRHGVCCQNRESLFKKLTVKCNLNAISKQVKEVLSK